MKKILLASAIAMCTLTSVSVFAATTSAPAGAGNYTNLTSNTSVTFKGNITVGTVSWETEQNSKPSNNVVKLKDIDIGSSNTTETSFALVPSSNSAKANTYLANAGITPSIRWTTSSLKNLNNPGVDLSIKSTNPNSAHSTNSNSSFGYIATATANSAKPGAYSMSESFTVTYS